MTWRRLAMAARALCARESCAWRILSFLCLTDQKSFSLVIVSDALDYLSPKYVNKTLLELTRVSTDGLVVFTGHPGHQKVRSNPNLEGWYVLLDQSKSNHIICCLRTLLMVMYNVFLYIHLGCV